MSYDLKSFFEAWKDDTEKMLKELVEKYNSNEKQSWEHKKKYNIYIDLGTEFAQDAKTAENKDIAIVEENKSIQTEIYKLQKLIREIEKKIMFTD